MVYLKHLKPKAALFSFIFLLIFSNNKTKPMIIKIIARKEMKSVKIVVFFHIFGHGEKAPLYTGVQW